MIHYITVSGVEDAWVANELRILQKEGIPFVLHTMRNASSTFHLSKWARQLERETRSLYPFRVRPMLASVLLAPALFGRRFFAALGNALFGERETVRGRIATLAHFFVACCWARSLRREQVSHIHSQWVHSCGTVGMYGAWLLNVPFSFTGHAADLFRNRVALTDKIRRADFIICISTFHRDFYLRHGARPEQLHLAYCGIDPRLFYPQRRSRNTDEPYRILSSGRLVGKKGFEYLIDACGILADRGEHFECTIAGSGPLEPSLRERVRQQGLDGRVRLTGKPLNQEEIPQFMHTGDIYCLPCVRASDGDIDGLPQMLMEAMACGLPAISTRLVGIPDLVIDGETGLLVAPNNAEQVADAIQRLAHDPELSERLAEQARWHIEEKFDIRTCLEPLLVQFCLKLGSRRHAANDQVAADEKTAATQRVR